MLFSTSITPDSDERFQLQMHPRRICWVIQQHGARGPGGPGGRAGGGGGGGGGVEGWGWRMMHDCTRTGFLFRAALLMLAHLL